MRWKSIEAIANHAFSSTRYESDRRVPSRSLLDLFQGGVLVDSVKGANAPELQRKIVSNLEQEKRILKEGGTRVEVSMTSLCMTSFIAFLGPASLRTCRRRP
jgi:hypothetical protein